jgi:pilus assembly protein CpaF
MPEPYRIDDRHGRLLAAAKTVREMICGSIDVIVQAARLRDGSRRITHITEVMGMEGDVIITQDLMLYEIEGEDANGG